MKIVSYIRVSTAKQHLSGLGEEGQREAIRAYAKSADADIVAEYQEVESGRNNGRPALQEAIRKARLTNSRLCIARLDRLSRNAAFLLTLQEFGVDFVCCDNPHATPLTIGVLSLVAAEEARAISTRTRAALQAAKVRGTKLGNPNGAEPFRRAGKGNVAAVQANKRRADARARDLSDTLRELVQAGYTTLQAQANELNRQGYKTPRGGKWHPSSVRNLQNRQIEA
ncbi:recombinase family protein [Roseovarius mucosus]|uniref:recombinase family protein n=1 Tax=Roseovarius mucosus TaxID=215743 RepID=UPI0035CF8FE3